MGKALTKNITSYDLLKFVAVLIMVTDHVGWYFHPHDLWWRAIGRIGFPVWFFLIGHANSRDLSWKLWAGAFILLAGNVVSGMYILPLNALFTIIVLRLMIDGLMKAALFDIRSLFAFSVVLLTLVIHSGLVVEYGTLAAVMAMLGYMVRHRADLELPRYVMVLFAAYAGLSFVLTQGVMFGFPPDQFAVMAAGTLGTVILLYHFRSLEFPRVTEKLPRFITALIQLGGRRTLEIYVIHLMAFKIACMVLYPDRYHFMHWTLFYHG